MIGASYARRITYKTDDMLTVFQTETIDAAELIIEFKRFMLAINYPPGKLG